jgi:hypothetical protein
MRSGRLIIVCFFHFLGKITTNTRGKTSCSLTPRARVRLFCSKPFFARRFQLITSLIAAFLLQPLPAQNAPDPPRDSETIRAYSPNTANLLLINEQSRAPTRAFKNNALALIEKLLAEGAREPEMLSALEYMALEGTVNKARLNGKIVNSFPDIRGKAALLLGNYGGEDAKRVLLRMLRADTDALTLADAVRALSAIGITPEDETLLNDMMTRFNTRYPENRLALAFIDAYQTYSAEHAGVISIPSRQTIFNLTTGFFSKTVKDKALNFLNSLHNLPN